MSKWETRMDIEMSKQRLLQLLRSERVQWDTLLAQVGPTRMTEQGVEGDWSLKDIIAHIAAYEDWIASTLEKVARGEPYQVDQSEILSVHQRNDAIYEQFHHRSLQEVLSFSLQANQRLLKLIEALSEQDLLQAQAFDGLLPPFWPDKPIWQTIAGNSYEHYHEHIPSIRRWLNRQP